MNIRNSLREFFNGKKYSLLWSKTSLFNPFEKVMPFSDVIFLNICDLLTDLTNDVAYTITPKAGNSMMAAEFKLFFDTYAQFVLNQLFINGYIVIGHNEAGFRIMPEKELKKKAVGDVTEFLANDPSIRIYVMKSITYELTGKADKTILNPFLTYLDNTLNASNTITARLGSFIVGSPKVGENLKVYLDEKEKKELEENLQDEHGALSNQRQIMLLQRPMDFQVVNLAGLDQRTVEKVRTSILAICDRLKVPANQVAIIDANSSKSLSNGSENREGDFNKYQSYERLLNRTFIKMAADLDLNFNYTMYNKPTRQTAQTQTL